MSYLQFREIRKIGRLGKDVSIVQKTKKEWKQHIFATNVQKSQDCT